MEKRSRSLAKAISWQLIGFIGSALITWWYTGRIVDGIALSGWLALSGAVLYVIHERLWARIHWGKSDSINPASNQTRPLVRSSSR